MQLQRTHLPRLTWMILISRLTAAKKLILGHFFAIVLCVVAISFMRELPQSMFIIWLNTVILHWTVLGVLMCPLQSEGIEIEEAARHAYIRAKTSSQYQYTATELTYTFSRAMPSASWNWPKCIDTRGAKCNAQHSPKWRGYYTSPVLSRRPLSASWGWEVCFLLIVEYNPQINIFQVLTILYSSDSE
jgi:hypothetical protein